jgi:hypothetical protein
VPSVPVEPEVFQAAMMRKKTSGKSSETLAFTTRNGHDLPNNQDVLGIITLNALILT